MVVKIQKSHKTMGGTLRYNQDKADKGVARMLAAFNMDAGSSTFRDYAKTFDRYERGALRAEKVSFQMSINPSPEREGERLSDSEAIAYAERLMEGLGYGRQPFLIYEHHDIDRVHYHVVSIRVDEQGRKIKDSFEERRLQELMRRLQQQFHYEVGDAARRERKARRPPAADLLRFDPGRGDVREQYDAIFQRALEYRYTSFVQFQAVMRGMGVDVKQSEGKDFYLIFHGTTRSGRKAVNRLSETQMPGEYYRLYEDRMRENAVKRPLSEEEKAVREEGRHRVAAIAGLLATKARTLRHLEMMLDRYGISMVLSRRDDGAVFGITLADQRSRAAYKASELSFRRDGKEVGLNADIIKEKAAPGGEWELNEKADIRQWRESLRAERSERAEAHDDLQWREPAPRTQREFLERPPAYFGVVFDEADRLLERSGRSRSRYRKPQQPYPGELNTPKLR